MKFHVHVYQVAGLVEVDVEAASLVEAKEKAIEDAEKLPLKLSDCKRMAVTFDEDDKFVDESKTN